MARYKPYDYSQMQMVPVALDQQLVPGTLEYAIHYLVEQRLDLALFDARYVNDQTGCRAFEPLIQAVNEVLTWSDIPLIQENGQAIGLQVRCELASP